MPAVGGCSFSSHVEGPGGKKGRNATAQPDSEEAPCGERRRPAYCCRDLLGAAQGNRSDPELQEEQPPRLSAPSLKYHLPISCDTPSRQPLSASARTRDA